MSKAAMKKRARPEADPLEGAPVRAPLGAWLEFAEALYGRSGAALGQVSASAHDEALYLLLRILGIPLDADPSVLERVLRPAEESRVREALRRRIAERVPAAYLTGEAWLGGLRFKVDERVIIPRSYFVEVIAAVPDSAAGGGRLADVCTGSGCLAILLARRFPKARVDAIDISAPALEVAHENVRAHRLSARVRLHRGDLFEAVPAGRYDLILSNPPYEPSAHCDALPPEFRREPRLALDGGPDGLVIIRRLIAQARERLKPGGRLLIEVGGLRRAMDREFGALRPRWLPTEDGADCVCEILARDL
jgi:ribosomal protein L3 glutamine methyltransferase